MKNDARHGQAGKTCCPILELRRYTLRPGRRDDLVTLFDREFVESQEAVGMRVLGQFHDRDDPDGFVWLRGFRDMESRAEALAAFYGGPVWKAHRDEANGTMIDSDDVLLLRPADPGAGFDLSDAVRPPAGGAPPAGEPLFTAAVCHPNTSGDEFARFFDDRVAPLLAGTGATPLARLRTEHAENTYPTLPVRTGEDVFVWFSAFANRERYDEHAERLARSATWTREVLPALSARLIAPPERLNLTPTARSLLR
ncbi:NIPSNAP family protein [Streptosporangium sp. NPDC002721]|uniref:NIPSNAP family protein n=1 Tax=Streptosporangium sp. NPDC002721 TaxID=3366188 RepID=UPI0036BC2AFA